MRTLDRRYTMSWGPRRRRFRGLRVAAVVLAVLVVLAAAGAGAQLLRPVPALRFRPAVPASVTIPGAPPALPWPASGQATVGVLGIGSLGSVGGRAPVPVASLTKVMTAYLVLTDHPLPPGADGPPVTMTAADVAAWQAGIPQGESVVKVAAGEQLSERQALEALLIASANNVAAALARWDAGGEAAFVAKMNSTAAALGMSHTRYADSIGLSPSSVSTAADQVTLAERAMTIPTFAAVVSEPQADLPVAGRVYNYDYLVGHDGIVGIKTGSTTQAGGCFLFAAHRIILGRDETVIGAVLGQRGGSELAAALNASRALIDAVPAQVRMVPVLAAGTPVGRIDVPWGRPVAVVTAGGAQVEGWPGLVVTTRLQAGGIGRTVDAGAVVATLHFAAGRQSATVPARPAAAVAGPPLSWRLRRR